jgi:hypothetical protein
MFGVNFCGLCRVVRGVMKVALSGMRVVSSRFVVARLVMPGRFPMVPGRVLVVFCSLMVVFCRLC